ncbi:Spo11/DNA topoisomerase VI subunit A [Aspergillus varians]
MEAQSDNLDLPSLSPPPTSNNHPQSRKMRVSKYLEDTLETVLTQLTLSEDYAEGDAKITLKRRATSASTTFRIDPSTGALGGVRTETTVTYSFPGKDGYDAWRFTVALRIFSAIRDAVAAGLAISIRDIYYSDPEYFESQRVVARFVDDLALTIGVERSDLNVECLIPRIQDIAELNISDVNWILIIEKEAVFRRLARSNFHTHAAAGKGILITGKGYPDLGTRAFIRKIFESVFASRSSRPPYFYALADGDPDGMAIVSTYKYGSMAHTRENWRLNINCLRWLGLRMSEVIGGQGPDGDETLMPLTMRDRRKIVSMLLRSPVWAADGPELEWRVELQRMLMLNVKAEIEILYDREDGLEGWIDREMGRQLG